MAEITAATAASVPTEAALDPEPAAASLAGPAVVPEVPMRESPSHVGRHCADATPVTLTNRIAPANMTALPFMPAPTTWPWLGPGI